MEDTKTLKLVALINLTHTFSVGLAQCANVEEMKEKAKDHCVAVLQALHDKANIDIRIDPQPQELKEIDIEEEIKGDKEKNLVKVVTEKAQKFCEAVEINTIS